MYVCLSVIVQVTAPCNRLKILLSPMSIQQPMRGCRDSLLVSDMSVTV